MYSLGTLLSSLHFLRSLDDEPVSVSSFSKRQQYVYTEPKNVQKLLVSAAFIYAEQGYWYPTEKGRELVSDSSLFSSSLSEEVKKHLRYLLKQSLMSLQPSWLTHVYKGRLECLQRIPSQQEKRDMALLLQELELLRETTEEAVLWWNELIQHFSPSDEEKTEIGKQGEGLSRLYEQQRVGILPYWESQFSNYSGYDLLSQISKDDDNKLYIEVKASSHNYVFYLTRGEWKKAQETTHYLFHFWHLPTEELYVFSPQDMISHVPVNQGNGQWTVCEITLSEKEQEMFRICKVSN